MQLSDACGENFGIFDIYSMSSVPRLMVQMLDVDWVALVWSRIWIK